LSNAYAGTIYNGPTVNVIYEPKPKQERGKGESVQATSAPKAEQSNEQQ